MAAISSAASGNWSAGATWTGGVAPTSADTVTILNTHTVTLDTTGCVCNTLTINSGGTLANTTSASWDITIGNATGDTINLTANSGSTVNIDMSAAAANTGTVYLNKGANTTGRGIITSGNCTLKGAAKTAWTRLNGAITAGATSATVDSATGWRVGDKIILGTTQAYNATPRIDEITLTSVNTGTGAIGWTGGITYDHADNGYVGNFTRNLEIRPYGTNKAFCTLQSGAVTVQDVLFTGLNTAGFGFTGLTLYDTRSGSVVSNNAFYGYTNAPALYQRIIAGTHTRQNNVFYGNAQYQYTIDGQAASVEVGNWEGCIVFGQHVQGYGIKPVNPGEKFLNCVVMACDYAMRAPTGYEGTLDTCSFLANNRVTSTQAAVLGQVYFNSCDIGTEFGAYNATVFALAGPSGFNLDDCDWQTSGTLYSGQSSLISAGFVKDYYRNGSVIAHEKRLYNGTISRDNSESYRATSSISIAPISTGTDIQQTRKILCANGKSIRVIGYVKKSHATNVAATVAITGLGITPASFTKANDTAWEKFDLTATNSSGNDGNFTLTYTANSSSGTTNVVYFDGVPDDPFVTKCRHYGFRYDETNPARVTNPTVSANEATAAAYTGITVTGSTSAISLGSDRTFQILYDYTQAWACTTANLAYDVPLTGAGVAGNAALFAVGNVTTTGYTLNGAGSLDMGSLTLTASLPWVYTYTGGTFSQATTEPTFNGGTLGIGDAGTFTFTMAGSTLVQVTPTAPGTYVFGAGSFTGTLTVNNLAAHAITVEVPAGTTTSDAGNTGGVITFQSPQVYQSVTLSGVTAGSRVQIYDTTSSTELFNDTSGYTWTDSVAAAADRAIRVRVSYVSGTTAKDFIEANIGTCGQTEGTKALTYLVAQTNDTTYNTNGIDGPAIYATSGITFTDSGTDLVNCNIAGGAVTYATMYACFVHWMNTATGIADDIAYIDAPDTANYLLTSMKIRNTSATDLTVTGGWGRDATTGLSKDIIDTAGSTGNIFLAPDHVIPYSVGSGLTAGQAAELTSAASAAATAASQTASLTFTGTSVHADIIKVSGTTVDGAGTEADPWGPV